jgi:hypothetical protein
MSVESIRWTSKSAVRRTILLGLIVTAASLLEAQEFSFQRLVSPFPIQQTDHKGQTIEYTFPFLGGLNAPRPQFVDIDGDGDLDLFLQERADELMFFENVGTGETYEFQWVTDRYRQLDVGNWFKFVDLDTDGDPDLFAESPFSLIRYLQFESDEDQFVVVTDTLRDTQGNLIFFDVSSTPDLTDIDCDGDLDLFIGRQTGTISHYDNTGIDAAGAPRFQFITDQFEGITIIGESPAQLTRIDSGRPTSHGSNALTFVDYDADEDTDLFWGDFFEPSIVLLENIGTCTDPDISITTRRFPAPVPLLSAGFNVPRFADIDTDGDFDLFVGILGDAFLTGPNSGANFYFYENFGAPGQPIYSLVETQFTPNVDIGLHSIPTFVDIDTDGDLDLFLSNEEDPADNLQSHLYFFENEGSASLPAFSLKSNDFLSFDLGLNFAPAFVDIDHDGDQDLFVGEWDGKLNFLPNNGTSEAPVFDTVEENFAGIDVGNNCTPVFADIDNDLDFDLIMGERLGKIVLYRNQGTQEEPTLQADTTIFKDINVGQYSAPAFGDIDGDGDQDLLVGSDDAGLFFYRNVGTRGQAELTLDPALAVNVDRRATPVAADLNADGDLDLILGGRSGGLMFFDNRMIVSSIEPRQQKPVVPSTIRLLQNHPNPFNPETTISYSLSLTRDQLGEFHTLAIYNLLGQRVRRWSLPNAQIDLQKSIRWRGLNDSGRSVPSGLYFYQLQVDSHTKLTRKLLLLQ